MLDCLETAMARIFKENRPSMNERFVCVETVFPIESKTLLTDSKTRELRSVGAFQVVFVEEAKRFSSCNLSEGKAPLRNFQR